MNVSTTSVAADSQPPLEQRLIGTWRWENQHSWIVVFREDGTLLDGPPGFRTVYNWQVVDERLFVNGVDWNIRLTDSTITVTRYGRSTYTYIWYSDSTEGETSLWLPILVVMFIIIVIGVIVLIIVLSRRKKRQKTSPYHGFTEE